VSAGVTVLLVLAAGTYALKAAGPLLLGERRLPRRVAWAVGLLPAALLAALVATSTAVTDGRWVIDARLPALAVAAVLLWRRAPFVVVVLGAAVTAALVRVVT
jgi:branched-subunit amino acid transport protein AzlD